MHIVQIAPTIGPGFGVAGVAWNLQQALLARGHTVEAFTRATAARPGARTRLLPRTRVTGAVYLTWRAVWFSTIGTRRARRFLAERPDAVSICHNAVMTGDVYVNHGVVAASMHARGGGWWRMLRNPVHVFTYVRDLIRYRGRRHSYVVVLSASEERTLRRVYGPVRPKIEVIPNGVDLDRFHPASLAERQAARSAFRLDDEHRVVLFVGHEFDRKGLQHAIEALVHAPTVLLLAVGGTTESIQAMSALSAELGVADRVLLAGRRTDLPLLLAAADLFTLPSAYEANALVILEALAAGVPVVATPVGYAPEVIRDGVNGYLCSPDPRELADRFELIAATEPGSWVAACRSAAESHGWATVADRYERLAQRVLAERGSDRRTTDRCESA